MIVWLSVVCVFICVCGWSYGCVFVCMLLCVRLFVLCLFVFGACVSVYMCVCGRACLCGCAFVVWLNGCWFDCAAVRVSVCSLSVLSICGCVCGGVCLCACVYL